jgi:hypothetical protein
MWFKMPKGTTSASFQQQSFAVEVTDDKGRGYFRAPDHFAPLILMGPGFELANEVPEGAPDDLPRADPLRDTAIGNLTAELSALRIECKTLREDANVAEAALNAMTKERDNLQVYLSAAEAKIKELEDEE